METILPAWEGSSWAKSRPLGAAPYFQCCKAKELQLQRSGETRGHKDKDITTPSLHLRECMPEQCRGSCV